MNDLIATAAEIQSLLTEAEWPFCFVGGLALLHWGVPRLTRDVDLTVFTGFGRERELLELLGSRYAGRIPDAAAFALRSRVYLLVSAEGIGIDVSLGAFEFEEAMVARAVTVPYLPGVDLRICSVEDLIVMKAFADRLKDWADIESILLRGHSINWERVESDLFPLVELKETPEIMGRLRSMRDRIS